MPSTFDSVGNDSVMPWPAKMSLIFPMPMTASPCFANRIQDRPWRLHREIVTVCGALEISCDAKKWASDHAPNPKMVGVTPCDAANIVKPLQRNDLFVRGDLQNRICGSVKNGVSGLNVLCAEFLQDCRPAPRAVAYETHRRLTFDGMHQFLGETFERCERLIENYSREFPMPGGGVFARGPLPHPSITAPG